MKYELIMENWRKFLQEKKISTPREVRLATLVAKKYAPKRLKSSTFYEKARFLEDADARKRDLKGGVWLGSSPWYFIKVLTSQYPDVTRSPEWKKFTKNVENVRYSFLKKNKAIILQRRELFVGGGTDIAPQKDESNTIFVNLAVAESRRQQRMKMLETAWRKTNGNQPIPKGAIDAINFTKIAELAGTLVHEVAHAEDDSELDKYTEKVVEDEIIKHAENGVFEPDEGVTEKDLQQVLALIYINAGRSLNPAKKRAAENYSYRSEIEFYQNLRNWTKNKLAAKPKSVKYIMMTGFLEELIDQAIKFLKSEGAAGGDQLASLGITDSPWIKAAFSPRIRRSMRYNNPPSDPLDSKWYQEKEEEMDVIGQIIGRRKKEK